MPGIETHRKGSSPILRQPLSGNCEIGLPLTDIALRGQKSEGPSSDLRTLQQAESLRKESEPPEAFLDAVDSIRSFDWEAIPPRSSVDLSPQGSGGTISELSENEGVSFSSFRTARESNVGVSNLRRSSTEPVRRSSPESDSKGAFVKRSKGTERKSLFWDLQASNQRESSPLMVTFADRVKQWELRMAPRVIADPKLGPNLDSNPNLNPNSNQPETTGVKQGAEFHDNVGSMRQEYQRLTSASNAPERQLLGETVKWPVEVAGRNENAGDSDSENERAPEWVDRELLDWGEALNKAEICAEGGSEATVKQDGPAEESPEAQPRRGRSWKPNPTMQSDLSVQVEETVFQLHKSAFCVRSGRLARLTAARPHVENTKIILTDMPGGARTFELVIRFCYGERLQMGPGNIAALRCAADYLEMTEHYSPPGHLNLLTLTEAFLDGVALRTMTDALKVLLSCQALGHAADSSGLELRAMDAVAGHIAQLSNLPSTEGRPGAHVSEEGVAENVTGASRLREKWMRRLSRLEVGCFSRLMQLLEQRGVDHRLIGSVILVYAQRAYPGLLESTWQPRTTWVFKRPAAARREPIRLQQADSELTECASAEGRVLEVLVTCLPGPLDAIPPGWVCALLAATRRLALARAFQEELEQRISGQLALVMPQDLILVSSLEASSSGPDVELVLRIVGAFLQGEAKQTRARTPDARAQSPAHVTSEPETVVVRNSVDRTPEFVQTFVRGRGSIPASSEAETTSATEPTREEKSPADVSSDADSMTVRSSGEITSENLRSGEGDMSSGEWPLQASPELDAEGKANGGFSGQEWGALKLRETEKAEVMPFACSSSKISSSPLNAKEESLKMGTADKADAAFDGEKLEEEERRGGIIDVESAKQRPNWGTLTGKSPQAIEAAVFKKLKEASAAGVSLDTKSGGSVRGFGSEFEVVSGSTEGTAKGDKPIETVQEEVAVERDWYKKPSATYRGLRRYVADENESDDLYIRPSPALSVKEPAHHLWEEAHVNSEKASPACLNKLPRRRGRGRKWSLKPFHTFTLEAPQYSTFGSSQLSLSSLQQFLRRSRSTLSEGLSFDAAVSEADARPSPAEVAAVAQILDEYLELISQDPLLNVGSFCMVATCLPDDAREQHDCLYRALLVFLKVRSEMPNEDKVLACRCIEWAKVSESAREEAAANQLLPDSCRVQILLVEQRLMKQQLLGATGAAATRRESTLGRNNQIRYLNLRAAAAEAFHEDLTCSLTAFQGLAAATETGGGPGLRVIKECAALKREHQKLEIESALVKMRLADLEKDHHVLLQKRRKSGRRFPSCCYWLNPSSAKYTNP